MLLWSFGAPKVEEGRAAGGETHVAEDTETSVQDTDSSAQGVVTAPLVDL